MGKKSNGTKRVKGGRGFEDRKQECYGRRQPMVKILKMPHGSLLLLKHPEKHPCALIKGVKWCTL